MLRFKHAGQSTDYAEDNKSFLVKDNISKISHLCFTKRR